MNPKFLDKRPILWKLKVICANVSWLKSLIFQRWSNFFLQRLLRKCSRNLQVLCLFHNLVAPRPPGSYLIESSSHITILWVVFARVLSNWKFPPLNSLTVKWCLEILTDRIEIWRLFPMQTLGIEKVRICNSQLRSTSLDVVLSKSV